MYGYFGLLFDKHEEKFNGIFVSLKKKFKTQFSRSRNSTTKLHFHLMAFAQDWLAQLLQSIHPIDGIRRRSKALS